MSFKNILSTLKGVGTGIDLVFYKNEIHMSFCKWFKRGRINKYKVDFNMDKKVIAGESTWFHS